MEWQTSIEPSVVSNMQFKWHFMHAQILEGEFHKVQILIDLVNVKNNNMYFEDDGFDDNDIQFMINDIRTN